MIKVLLPFIVLATTSVSSQTYRVGECHGGDCVDGSETRVIVVDEVTEVRERDLKAGLCLRDKSTGTEHRIERVDEMFVEVISHDASDDVIELREMMRVSDDFEEVRSASIPIPCDNTIYGDKAYMEACLNGADRWSRMNYCLDRKTLRRQQMYGL